MSLTNCENWVALVKRFGTTDVPDLDVSVCLFVCLFYGLFNDVFNNRY